VVSRIVEALRYPTGNYKPFHDLVAVTTLTS
jgi:hypothetical protein